ncbi:toll/interleukin-1 receptor domain-containing protein [Erysipelothrix rhusiopathiae]|uniref:toll/interleukin-1 receptor domain-containing protein n=1 Tax=Erysipelothrix rhusiopathiae TaxID=1648 RepID=UPI00295561AC|nr:toll/interleukin-1 receptor domain-containing protein [Erysipelothrix rhusiopathiae]MDV7679348.1 toll/interleukin-1 receptor domain-containing protein [Erysipelothrix rhusiopathiae]
MKVFFSWSGAKSNHIAKHFRELLENIYYDIDIYFSDQDIGAGDKWRSNIENGLDNNDLGIIFLTPDNLSSKWIYFEAGALSKAMSNENIVPIIYDLKPTDISEPLASFQAKSIEKNQILDVVLKIGKLMQFQPNSSVTERTFDLSWEKFNENVNSKKLSKIEDQTSTDISDANVMTNEQKIDELLKLTRSQLKPNQKIINVTDIDKNTLVEEFYIEDSERKQRKNNRRISPIEEEYEIIFRNDQSMNKSDFISNNYSVKKNIDYLESLRIKNGNLTRKQIFESARKFGNDPQLIISILENSEFDRKFE